MLPRMNTTQIEADLNPDWWLDYFNTNGVSWPSCPIYFINNSSVNLVFSYNWFGLPVPAGDSPTYDNVYNQITTTIIPFTAKMLSEYACAGNISNTPPA